MNKDQIEKRLEELKTNHEQLKNNLIATAGAIQDCEYWLSQLEEKKTKPIKE